MDMDNASSSPVASSSGISGAVGELKIKGQAEVERRKSKWERQEDGRVSLIVVFLGV